LSKWRCENEKRKVLAEKEGNEAKEGEIEKKGKE